MHFRDVVSPVKTGLRSRRRALRAGSCRYSHHGNVGVGSAPCAAAVGIITGLAAEKFMRGLTKNFENVFVFPIKNNFFGESVTVSGLLTGADIVAQIHETKSHDCDIFFVPENAFCDGIMLDGTSLETLSEKLGVPVIIGSADGGEFFSQLKELLC
jgi:hypothetical protein